MKPHIGLDALPADAAAVCDVQYLGDFDTSGYAIGDTVNDFTLYNLNGDVMHLAEALQNGKPKLFIAGSYTCPVFRNRIPHINSIVGNYGGLVDVIVVYTIEAHPSGDISPYFGYENVTSQNQQDGVLFPQPDTYDERKALAAALIQEFGLNATVLIDGPCNEWWLHYGPAPVNATLVDTNGLVVAKHAWFNQYPQNMMCALDTLLGTAFGNCNTGSASGSFSVTVLTDDTIVGLVGETHTAAARLINNTPDPVYIEVKRQQQNLPQNWSTAMCLDACYSASVSQANVLVAAGDTQLFYLYFFNDTIPGTGSVKMQFTNVNNNNNAYERHFHVRTKNPAGVGVQAYPNVIPFSAFPNPANNTVRFSHAPVLITDVTGRALLYSSELTLDISELPSGTYHAVSAKGNRTLIKR